MVLKPDQERVKALLKETIVLLCKNGLEFTSEFSIEALVGITIDKDNVFLISIAETVESLAKQLEDEEKAKAEEAAKAEAARIEAEKQQAAARRSPKRRPSHSESPRRHKRQMLASDTGQSYDNNESFSSETYNNYESSNTSGTQDSEYKSSRFKNIKQEVTEDDDDSDLVIVKQEGVTNRDFTNCAPQGGDVNFSSISSAIHAPPDGDMMSQQNYSLQSPSGASQWDMSQAGDPNSQQTWVAHAPLMRTEPWINQPNKPKRPYTCKVCLKRFTNGNDVRGHMIKEHGAPMEKCDFCGKQFVWLATLRQHLAREHNGAKLRLQGGTRNYEQSNENRGAVLEQQNVSNNERL